MSNTPQGRVRVAASITAGQSLIAPLLSSFNQQFPEITLDLQLSNRRVDVINEAYDVAIRIGPSLDSSMISKKLCSVVLRLFASADYLAQQPRITQPQDISQHACLYMNALDEKSSWQLSNEKETVQLSLKPNFVCNDYTTLALAAVNNMGVCLLPDYIYKKHVANHQLVAVLPDWLGRCVDIYAIYPSRDGVTPKLRAFLDFLSVELASE